METLTTIISIILLLGLIISPILLFIGLTKLSSIKFKFLTYLTLGVICTTGIILIFAWWSDTSNQFLLKNYGYTFEAMNETDRFANVSEKDMERVKSFEANMFGIGWPLKAIMTFVFYSPYLLIVYVLGQLIRRTKRNRKKHALRPLTPS